MKGKRESRILPIWQFPAGVRQRSFGLLHDQIWFYAPLDTKHYDELDVAYEDPHGVVCVDTKRPWRYWRQLEDDRWLRLYMDRWILKTPWRLFRLHTFYTGDEAHAPHDHPFDFWTLPLATYRETVEMKEIEAAHINAAYDAYKLSAANYAHQDVRDWFPDRLENVRSVGTQSMYIMAERTVRRFRIHYRPAEYRHMVHEPERPFKTLVVARVTRPRKWGYWPDPHIFVPFDVWTKYD